MDAELSVFEGEWGAGDEIRHSTRLKTHRQLFGQCAEMANSMERAGLQKDEISLLI